MKLLYSILTFSVCILSSGCSDGVINGNFVLIDSSVHPVTFTLKTTGEKVNGSVEFFDTDATTGIKYRNKLREIKNGIRINNGFEYYPSGQIFSSVPFVEGNRNGTGKFYNEDGSIQAEVEYKNDMLDGVTKIYHGGEFADSEYVFKEGELKNRYALDDRGNRIIPALEKIELIKYETGFYEYVNYNTNEVLYQPMIKMKWRNITQSPLTDRIVITGTFVSGDEEWSTESDYFQGVSDAPLQPNIARQSMLQSSVGWKTFLGIVSSKVYCEVRVNDIFFKKIKIANDMLTSNRIN